MDAGIDRQQRRTGIGGDLDRWRDARREQWQRGDRHLVYTLIAIMGMALLGAIVVPLSIPDAPPGPPREQVLGERYLAAISAPDAPPAVRVNSSSTPTLDSVTSEFGADGGAACTAPVATTYATLLTKRPGGGTAFDTTALARAKVVQGVYCPDRTAELTDYVATRQAANARARTLAQREQGVSATA